MKTWTKISLLILLLFVFLSATGISALAAGGVSISSTNFPDASFRKYISDEFDTNGDGKLSKDFPVCRTIE